MQGTSYGLASLSTTKRTTPPEPSAEYPEAAETGSLQVVRGGAETSSTTGTNSGTNSPPRYGHWTDQGPAVSPDHRAYRRVACDCGNVRDVALRNLRSGTSTRCRSCAHKALMGRPCYRPGRRPAKPVPPPEEAVNGWSRTLPASARPLIPGTVATFLGEPVEEIYRWAGRQERDPLYRSRVGRQVTVLSDAGDEPCPCVVQWADGFCGVCERGWVRA